MIMRAFNVPMQAGHVLLGRPWQFDRRVMHDGYSNRFSFTFLGVKHVLVPLSPKEVYADQVKLQQSAKVGKGSEASQKNEGKEASSKKKNSNGLEVSDCTGKGKNVRCAGEKTLVSVEVKGELNEKSEEFNKSSFYCKERES